MLHRCYYPNTNAIIYVVDSADIGQRPHTRPPTLAPTHSRYSLTRTYGIRPTKLVAESDGLTLAHGMLLTKEASVSHSLLAHGMPLTKEPHIGLRAHTHPSFLYIFISLASSLFVSVVMSEEDIGRQEDIG